MLKGNLKHCLLDRDKLSVRNFNRKEERKKERKATSVHKLSPDSGYVAALKLDQD